MRIRKNLKAIPFVFAALWAVGAGVFLLLAQYGEGRADTVMVNPDGTTSFFDTTVHASFYGVQGAQGVTLLVLFTLIYLGAAVFALWKRYIILGIVSFIAFVVTFIGSLSIGFIYFPALYAVIIGWIILGVGKMISMSQESAADDTQKQPE